MTKEEKINWLRKSTNEEVLDQLLSAQSRLSYSGIGEQVEAQEDVELAREEILRRMAK